MIMINTSSVAMSLKIGGSARGRGARGTMIPKQKAERVVRVLARERPVEQQPARVTRILARGPAQAAPSSSTQRSLSGGSGPTAKAHFPFGSWAQRLIGTSVAVAVALEKAATAGVTRNAADDEVEHTDDSSDSAGEEETSGRISTQRTLERPRKQRKLSSGPVDGGIAGGLEQNAVRPAMNERYRLYSGAFLQWSGLGSLVGAATDTVDAKLVLYFEFLFSAGHKPWVGATTLAALSHVHPPLGHGNRSMLLRSTRALKGWRRLCPPRSRVAEAWPVIAGVIMILLQQAQVGMALWCIMCFGLYLRPSECMRLRGRDLVPPADDHFTSLVFCDQPIFYGRRE